MSDIALERQSDGSFDLCFNDSTNDLEVSDGLYNAVIISIGTFARSRNLPVNKANLAPSFGGWWADALDGKGTLGGYLYEAFPGKLDEATAEKVKNLAVESLLWMKEDGIANKVECEAKIEGENIVLYITITKPDGAAETFEYELNWEATNGI